MSKKDFTSYSGKMLISNSSVITDVFNKTVVILAEHDRVGAFGLVINKTSNMNLSDIIQDVDSEFTSRIPIYWGGPVDYSFVSILHENYSIPSPGLEVIPGVFMSRSYDVLLHLIKERNSRFNVFNGYSGWGAGQLESEIDRKSWVIQHSIKDLIFHDDASTVWKEALVSKGGIYRYFAEHIKDPLLN